MNTYDHAKWKGQRIWIVKTVIRTGYTYFREAPACKIKGKLRNFPNIWQKSCEILNRQIRKLWVQTFGDKEQTEKLDVDRQDVSSAHTFFFYTTCAVWLKVENNKGSRVLCKLTYFVYANWTCWLLCFYTLWRATHPHVYEVQHKPMF